jgi:hypothetical protein
MKSRYYFAMMLTLCTMTGSTDAAESRVYKWVDADGVTHYSESRPASPGTTHGTVELEPVPPPASDLEADYYSVINQARRMQEERLERERVRASMMRAEAEARRAEAEIDAIRWMAQQETPQVYRSPVYQWPYTPYPYPYAYYRRDGRFSGYRADRRRRPHPHLPKTPRMSVIYPSTSVPQGGAFFPSPPR